MIFFAVLSFKLLGAVASVLRCCCDIRCADAIVLTRLKIARVPANTIQAHDVNRVGADAYWSAYHLLFLAFLSGFTSDALANITNLVSALIMAVLSVISIAAFSPQGLIDARIPC